MVDLSPGDDDITYRAALAYIAAGIYVNPVYVTRRPDGKKDVRPVGKWRETSSISASDIYAWWVEQHPTAGILIDCGKSELVVIDCDGPEGIANWAELDQPMTAVVHTAGGGEHHYYRAHPRHVIGNDQDGKVAPSVDVRGLGGFVIAPPTSDGQGTWEWIGEVDWATLPEVPQLVIDRMTARPAPTASLPAAAPVLAADDDLGATDERTFTEDQAKAFIGTAIAKLGQATRGFNGAINAFAMACAHFPTLVDRARCARLAIRALEPVTGWTAPDHDDLATINSAYSATEAGRSWTATMVEAPTPREIVTETSDGTRLEIRPAADMAYWLQDNLGHGRLAGFFLRHGEMVHTPRINELGYVAPKGDQDGNGPAEIRPVAGPVLAAKLQYLYECFKVVKATKTEPAYETAAMFPRQAAQVAVDAPEALEGLRVLRGITSTPMVRVDGSLIEAPGYDSQSGYLFLPGQGVDVPEVPSRPGGAEVARARNLLLDMVVDFPFATADDRANYLGLLLTPMLREVAPPSYKLFGIGAHQPGSGKSLLAEVASIIHGGVLRSEVPDDEAEWGKLTSSILATTSAPVVVLDNVTGILKSSTLAGLLTAGRETTSRVLGASETMTVANDRTWVITGNNLSLGGDLVRRTVTILIDPDAPNPERRTDFRIKDLTAWVAEHRNEVLWALLVLIRAWVCEGMSEPERAQSDSFARWARVISGVLMVAGIEGAFDAESGRRAAGGGDDDGLAQMLGALHDRFSGQSFTVAEALTVSASGPGFLTESLDWLPAAVLDKLERSPAGARKTMGWFLRNRIGRWVTDAEGRSLVIREVGVGRTGARWKIELR